MSRTTRRIAGSEVPRVTLLGAGLAALLVSSPAGAQDLLYTFQGDADGDLAGFSVSGAGDVNADGYDDLIVGIMRDDVGGLDNGSAWVLSGRDGRELYLFPGGSDLDEFGRSVSDAGDVNNDGYDDVIVGAPRDDDAALDAGSATVLSGFDGSVLYTFTGDAADDRFGLSVSGAGDVDMDGRPDLIVGCYLHDQIAADAGMARVYSGLDGSVLHSFYGESAGDYLGFAVADAGDVDNDGYADLIAGAHHTSTVGIFNGRARVWSGQTGGVLHTFEGDSDGDRFGFAVAGAGDVDSDGNADLIVGVIRDDDTGTDAGSARVLSGADGSTLHDFYGQAPFDEFGWAVDGAGDVDQDGYADLVIGSPREDFGAAADVGFVYVYSGQLGGLLWTAKGRTEEEFGYSVACAGDPDGNGIPDLAVGVWHADELVFTHSGKGVVLSGQDLTLTADRHALSLSAGGSSVFVLDGDASHAGHLYLLLGSASGISTGFPVDQVHVPLNIPDPYFNFTLKGANSPVLPGSLGFLNEDGDATASLVIPSGSSPTLAGLLLDHAFIAFDLGSNGVVSLASNSVPLILTP